jgi:hypothetical protein
MLTPVARWLSLITSVVLVLAAGCEDPLPPLPTRPDAANPAPINPGPVDAGVPDVVSSDVVVKDGADGGVDGDFGGNLDARDGGAANDASDGGADVGPAPIFVLGGTVFGTPTVTYVVTSRSLEAKTIVDYEAGLPLFGGAVVLGPELTGHFFVASGESPTITRWAVSAEGHFSKGPTMSLAAHGLSSALINPGGAIFLSPTKAYFIHQEELKAVIWNPTTMEITGTLALPAELVRPGFVVVLDGKAQRRGKDLYLVASWADHTNGKYPAGSLLVTIDTTTDTVVSKEVDSRCGQLFDSVALPSGDIYYASTPWVAATNRVLGKDVGGEPCILRLPNGQRRFDPAFQADMRTLFGSTAGALVSGGGTTAFVRVLDETLVKFTSTTIPADVAGAEAWVWWRLDLSTMATSKTNLPPSAAGGTEFTIEGRVFTSVSKQDFSETTLVEMTAPGGPKPGMVLRGYAESGLRVR